MIAISHRPLSITQERTAILSLAAIMAFRMLGLFLIFPVFTLYAPQLQYANPTLIGIALGIYGLTQALFQLPLSTLSDHIGRKPVILAGLGLFALGSIIAALTHNIYILIVGRALQGAGAIGSTLMALTADLTPVESRTRSMAIIGMTIGLSFALSMIFGPSINAFIQLSGIFWLTALMALIGSAILYFLVPKPAISPITFSWHSILQSLTRALQHKELLKYNISILLLHAILASSFSVIPFSLKQIGINMASQWQVYFPALFAAFGIIFPLITYAEKKSKNKQLILWGIAAMGVAQWFLYSGLSTPVEMTLVLFVFFTGFTLLEAILPSTISKLADPAYKGTAIGIFSSFQFLGIFLGGIFAGIIRTYWYDGIVFFCCLALCAIWLIFMFFALQKK